MAHAIHWRFILATTLCWLILPTGRAVAAEKAMEMGGKATSVVGDVQLLKPGKPAPAPLRVGMKVKQGDQVRTLAESQAVIEMRDGSKVSIEENTLVHVAQLVEDGPASNTRLEIKSGGLLFDIHKLASAKSTFEFHTSTATAAIRGTAGGIGSNGRRTFAFLHNGSLYLLLPSGADVEIGAGELAIEMDGEFRVFRAQAGDSLGLQNLFLRLTADTSSSDSLFHALVDSLFPPHKAQVTTDTSVQSGCVIDPYPSSTDSTTIRISGRCPPGIFPQVAGTRAIPQGNGWILELAWPESAYGPKQLDLRCNDGMKESACGRVSLLYTPHKLPLGLVLSTPVAERVCEDGFHIAGRYVGTDTKLYARQGLRTIDLSSGSGVFDRTLLFTDAEGTWDLDRVFLQLVGADSTSSMELRIAPDRTCKGVNTLPPELQVSMDAGACEAVVDVGRMDGDAGELTVLVDGLESAGSQFQGNIRDRRFSMAAGTHNYEIRARDQAGNLAVQKFSAQTCRRIETFDLVLDGPSLEVSRLPPSPPGGNRPLEARVKFQIRNLPEGDWRYLQRILVRSNGRTILDARASQIDRTSWEVAVPLVRKGDNVITVEAFPYQGVSRKASKTIRFE